MTNYKKNKEIKNEELNNIATWQEKYADKGSIVYLASDLKEFGVSSFSTPCNAFEYLKNNNNAELTSTNYDSLGIALAGNDAMILLGKKTDKPNQVATVDQNYINSLRQQRDSIKQQFDSEKAALDAQEKTLQENKEKTDLEKRYKEFLSQITIAIAADNLKSGSKPLSVSCSEAGSVRFSYISDKLSSASTSYGSIYVSAISNKVSSASGLGSYYCSYIGDNISSCSAPTGSAYFSHIGDEISSAHNSMANVMTYFSYIGNSISSASEADLGSCSIN